MASNFGVTVVIGGVVTSGTTSGTACKNCGGPCPPTAPNARQSRVFCSNPCRAAWRIKERNREIQDARDTLQGMDDALAAMRLELQKRIDVLDRLIIHPRTRKAKSSG